MAGELALIAVVWGMVAFAVLIDASRRNRNGGFWAVLTFFTGLFGALLYAGNVLLTDQPEETAAEKRRTSGTVRVCPDCSAEHDGSVDYCEDCGAELGPDDERPVARRLMTGSDRYCSNCRSEVDRGADVCGSDGAVF
jgi:hypothetical protein